MALNCSRVDAVISCIPMCWQGWQTCEIGHKKGKKKESSSVLHRNYVVCAGRAAQSVIWRWPVFRQPGPSLHSRLGKRQPQSGFFLLPINEFQPSRKSGLTRSSVCRHRNGTSGRMMGTVISSPVAPSLRSEYLKCHCASSCCRSS